MNKVEAAAKDLPADWRAWFEERAAIREYDGGMARDAAEKAALDEVRAEMKRVGAAVRTQ